MVRGSAVGLVLVPETGLDKVTVLAVALTPVIYVPAGRLLPTISCPTASPAVNDNPVTVLLPPVTAPIMALGADTPPPVTARDSSRGPEVPVAAFDMVSVPAVKLIELIVVADGMLAPAIVCPTAGPAVFASKDAVLVPATTVPLNVKLAGFAVFTVLPLMATMMVPGTILLPEIVCPTARLAVGDTEVRLVLPLVTVAVTALTTIRVSAVPLLPLAAADKVNVLPLIAVMVVPAGMKLP